MDIVIVAFFLFVGSVVIMSVGVIFGRQPIKGTCGGINQMMGSHDCEICGGGNNKCDANSVAHTVTK